MAGEPLYYQGAPSTMTLLETTVSITGVTRSSNVNSFGYYNFTYGVRLGWRSSLLPVETIGPGIGKHQVAVVFYHRIGEVEDVYGATRFYAEDFSNPQDSIFSVDVLPDTQVGLLVAKPNPYYTAGSTAHDPFYAEHAIWPTISGGGNTARGAFFRRSRF